jgi:hypothetical protein
MATSHQDLKNLIRDGVRSTIHNTLSSVIQEVTEEELRSALKDPAFKDPLMKVIRLELQRLIQFDYCDRPAGPLPSTQSTDERDGPQRTGVAALRERRMVCGAMA